MADPQEFNSLDELFRKTFEDLPDTPSASGWDKPSPRVWEAVRVRLTPPKNGWSTQALLLVGGLAVALMLGLYWTISKPSKELPAVANPTTTAATEVAAPKSEPILSPEVIIPAPEATPSASTAPRKPLMHREEHPNRQTERVQLPGSAPLPGTHPVLPNTTVRRHALQWRTAPWAQPLAPLPTVLQRKSIRPLPAGVLQNKE